FRLQAEGACRARVDGNYETILPGDLLLYSPDQPYELSIQPRSLTGPETIQPVGDYYLMGNGAWLDNWWRAQELPTKVNIGLDDKVITLWKHLIGEKKNMLHHQEQLMDYLLKAFCLTLERVIQTSQQAKGDDTARKLKQYIDNHAHEPLRLEDISASVGLSVSRSSHLFKAAFGRSLYAYCLDVRLKQAEQLVLYSSLMLEHIAEKTGFQSYPHFCRMFRERLGYAPGQYRHTFGIRVSDG
ncbi:helix-turn-helix domain-containing protein, partial [Paenibacillus sp. 598K]|uniref:helix-turn-helix domain-containing protein n=1 Tax=Paenibacillus sp. 598K TaxID=1117987 RepID=UPI0011D00186